MLKFLPCYISTGACLSLHQNPLQSYEDILKFQQNFINGKEILVRAIIQYYRYLNRYGVVLS